MASKRSGHVRRQPAWPPASGCAPGRPLAPQAVDASADDLTTSLGLWADVWPRRQQREWSAFYRCVQLSHLERKTIDPVVLALRGPDPSAMRPLQPFIAPSYWASE